MAEVADHMTTILSNKRHLVFVPARGGLGEAVSIQANSVSAQMAKKKPVEKIVCFMCLNR